MRTQPIASFVCLLIAGAAFGQYLSAAQPAVSTTPAPAATPPAAAATGGGDPPGKAPYYRICVNCHGEPTEGGDGPALVPMFHDPQEVLSIVRSGQAKMLPITPEKISDDEVLAVVDYLTQLTKQ